MQRLAAVAVIFFWPLLASAADWQVVTKTKLGDLRMDRGSVTREGKFTAAVLEYEFNELQKLSFPPFTVFNRRQDDVLVDCSNPLLGLHSSRFFDGEKLINTFTLKSADVKFHPPAPDTMAAKVVKLVCAAPLKIKP